MIHMFYQQRYKHSSLMEDVHSKGTAMVTFALDSKTIPAISLRINTAKQNFVTIDSI